MACTRVAHQRRAIRVSEVCETNRSNDSARPEFTNGRHMPLWGLSALLTGGKHQEVKGLPLTSLHIIEKPAKGQLFYYVEMGGLEPPSKHSTQRLSTRLFL